jgi:hypothetical protein
LSSAAIRSDTPQRRPPRLQLVEGCAAATAHPRPHEPRTPPAWDGFPAAQDACVLVAGSDAVMRSTLREELCDLLPAGTRFTEAGETWEVIARACASSMVVLAGDLGDVSAESLMRLLGRRHPTLPVLAVAEKASTRAAADVAVPGA